MNSPILIGITGKAGSGKDSLANMLDTTFYNMRPLKQSSIKSFAKPLKTVAASLFNIPDHYFISRGLKETSLPEHNNLSPRQILQKLGTSIRNEFGPNIFIKIMKSRIESPSRNSITIISDVRYQNEAEFILSYPDAILISITRNINPCETPHSSHDSEDGICFPDLKCPERIIHVENDDSLLALKCVAEVLAARYM